MFEEVKLYNIRVKRGQRFMFGERLQEVLDINDMTQKQLAGTLGVGIVTVNRWIQNVYEPDLNTLLRISKLFDVSTDYLIGRDDEFNNSSKKKDFLDRILRECGYLQKGEKLSNKEVDKILRFIVVNKDYIRPKVEQ